MIEKFNAIQTTDIRDLVKKADYNTKLTKFTRKHLIRINILRLKLNKLPAKKFAARLK